MQKRYRYQLTAPMGQNFDPEFKPELTPKEMLELEFAPFAPPAPRLAHLFDHFVGERKQPSAQPFGSIEIDGEQPVLRGSLHR